MKRIAPLAAIVLALVSTLSLGAQPVVSEKKQVAVFALGYYGWAIPKETLGNIDMEIQKVFTDLGRFEIIGVTQRLSSGGVGDFIATLKKAKEANFVMPDKYQFGEAILTEADFNKLLGAFIVAAPVVSSFNSAYSQKSGYWETELKTNVTFIDVAAGGTTLAIAEVKTSGSDKENQTKSITNAIESIPSQLQYEIRKIPAFQISTRILAAAKGEIKMQLGQNMGIRKGDEYSVITTENVEGFKNDTERGLIQIKEVGSEVSTGRVVYSSVDLGKDVQLREIPRLGTDAEGYFHLAGGTALPGIKGVASRGFYGFRPYFAAQIPLSESVSTFWGFLDFIPVNGVVGGEFNLYLGRLELTPYAGVGASYVYVMSPKGTEETSWLSHYGAQAYLRASYLFTRELKVFAEAGAEYWLSANDLWFNSYGGVSFGAGVSYKL